MSAPVLRQARPAERARLEALQRRASEHSGTYREQLRAHPDAIVLPDEQIAQGLVRVAEEGGAVVGFAVLLAPAEGACELDGLFVEPARWRGGVGRRLVEDAARTARAWGAREVGVVANPDAYAFYERVGFTFGDEVATRFGPARRMTLRLV